jgi:hypothetical protein
MPRFAALSPERRGRLARAARPWAGRRARARLGRRLTSTGACGIAEEISRVAAEQHHPLRHRVRRDAGRLVHAEGRPGPGPPPTPKKPGMLASASSITAFENARPTFLVRAPR